MRLVIVSIISACVFGQQPIQNYPPGSAVRRARGATFEDAPECHCVPSMRRVTTWTATSRTSQTTPMSARLHPAWHVSLWIRSCSQSKVPSPIPPTSLAFVRSGYSQVPSIPTPLRIEGEGWDADAPTDDDRNAAIASLLEILKRELR